jgi:hypothetical protein
MNWQTLTRDTIAGTQQLQAPAGWEFDATAVLVWSTLVQRTREMHGPGARRRTRLAHFRLDGQIEELANVLANALGMAAPYWYDAAREVERNG